MKIVGELEYMLLFVSKCSETSKKWDFSSIAGPYSHGHCTSFIIPKMTFPVVDASAAVCEGTKICFEKRVNSSKTKVRRNITSEVS